ncbi:uncharacterized protein L969DRAFT_47360 [Mixia osmundae IAM 14324]|uniref:Uncharacterized protein n=1 Tax=Mixia osmundae (strain CBS 9802 / IAM 14324 / JCM 22182 / KY 12970) TaxID=764103 RepID=G7E937_MIXOS|nr:uncharacterized protein L969DRAFT_47360 [Mixia osmundae IAM 14324]KEI40291.1 hypothetical protein L969DRAFT_47360 [Mixia osmundae IAM 14324]GAA99655.1 hypothetical protein E5Q_06358 [Mixia osmundae IAM 14324]
MAIPIPASFWRGGTSRALMLRANAIASYSPAIRDKIILAAMGSPDPDGRQIDGLGGGYSSVSKTVVISQPGEGLDQQRAHGRLPGPDWADDADRTNAYDVVYRFAQVGVREPKLDWAATCGNMLSAVAVSAIDDRLVPESTLRNRLNESKVSLRILANTGTIFTAHVPVNADTLRVPETEDATGYALAGVPGLGLPVELEFPLDPASTGAFTGRTVDTVPLAGRDVPCSMITAGLPNLFVRPEDLGLPLDTLTRSPADLDSDDQLRAIIENFRHAAAQIHDLTKLQYSAASPKVCLIGGARDYTTTGGETLKSNDFDIIVRAFSTGDAHRSVPGTTLTALSVARSIKGSLVESLCLANDQAVQRIRVGHPAGVAESAVVVSGEGAATAVLMTRTAREIMRGEVMIPSRCFEKDDQ